MKKKWIVIPSLLVLTVVGAYATMPVWRPFWPSPKVAVDSAMRAEAVDTLVAKLNDHYIFPDKAKQIEAVLRQRQNEGKYDRMTDGEQLAKQLTDKLADTDGLIVDLRDNGGGLPQSVDLMISYFVDQRTRLNDIWDRDTGITTQHWTEDKLDGKRYGGKKPVVILAGPGTMSAGEDFAYTMQALKRATVIGEPTWGGANPARPLRLGDHFFAVIPSRRIINPITHTNWEGVGVIPDVAAAPDKALEAATDLLQRRLHGTAPLVAAGQ